MRIAEGEDGVDASVVVVGLDRALSFDRLRIATLAIARGATFVASNTDATFPAAEGAWPGAGAIVAALRTSTGREPLVAGKPDPTLLEIAGDRLGGAPALVVGDRVETDILCAQAAGWPSALVLTGSTTVRELAAAPAWPDFIVRTLPELLENRPHPQIRQASGPDLPQIATILHNAGLMSGAARERLGRTVVAEADRRVIGTAAWEVLGDEVLLRSVAAQPEYRNAGVGTALVAGALRRILESGYRSIYLVTENAEPFFAACGFATIKRDDLPDTVAGHPQVTRECPINAPAMRIELPQN
jgi:N-acetylglutamate synthase-like GNAT family acetyltransferase